MISPPKTFAAFVVPLLLAALALLAPGKVVAGPPDGPSGRMVLDEVSEGLRKYRKAKDVEKRIDLLWKLAPTCDPRVAVALGEALEKYAKLAASPTDEEEVEKLGRSADRLLNEYYVPRTRLYHFQTGPGPTYWVEDWWKANKADLRRRAAQLPR
jgi:hypothetical protein